MKLCTLSDVQAFLLKNYIDAATDINPAIVDETIEKVSGEIRDMLAYYYIITEKNAPMLVKNIAAVFSAYRVMCAITGIIDTESGAGNVWLPLQQEYKRMGIMLTDIAKGVLTLPLPKINQDREDAGIAVVSKPNTFDLTKY